MIYIWSIVGMETKMTKIPMLKELTIEWRQEIYMNCYSITQNEVNTSLRTCQWSETLGKRGKETILSISVGQVSNPASRHRRRDNRWIAIYKEHWKRAVLMHLKRGDRKGMPEIQECSRTKRMIPLPGTQGIPEWPSTVAITVYENWISWRTEKGEVTEDLGGQRILPREISL